MRLRSTLVAFAKRTPLVDVLQCSSSPFPQLLPKSFPATRNMTRNAADDDGLPETFLSEFHDRNTLEKLRYNELGKTGMRICALGIGGGGFGGFYESVDEEKASKAVNLAIKCGLNFIDTAPWYGNGKSEQLLGKILKTIPRKSYYIATKIGRYETQVTKMFDFSAQRVISSVDHSLKLLGLDYVDIIQVHDLEFAPNLEIIVEETLPALEKIRNAGKARFIGITGYPVQTLLEVVKRSHVRVDTVLSYARYGLFNNDLTTIIPQLKERGVGVINAAPIGMGLLCEKGPPKWHAADDDIKSACKRAVAYAKERGVDAGDLALKQCYASKDIATTLVSMERPEIVQSNINVVLSPMTPKETEVRDEIIHKFFEPLSRTEWEVVDVAKYWKELKEAEEKETQLIHP